VVSVVVVERHAKAAPQHGGGGIIAAGIAAVVGIAAAAAFVHGWLVGWSESVCGVRRMISTRTHTHTHTQRELGVDEPAGKGSVYFFVTYIQSV
jgi:hypothetical protein